MKIQNKTVGFIIVMSLGFNLTGCNENIVKEETLIKNDYNICAMPSSKRLSLALQQSKTALSTTYCQANFMSHFKANLEIAKGDPRSGNLELFGDFAHWAAERGIISKRDKKELLSRYFVPDFVSFKFNDDLNTYSTCSLLPQKNKILSDLDIELTQKKLGFSKVLGDNKTYQTLSREKETLVSILNSTLSACEQSTF